MLFRSRLFSLSTTRMHSGGRNSPIIKVPSTGIGTRRWANLSAGEILNEKLWVDVLEAGADGIILKTGELQPHYGVVRVDHVDDVEGDLFTSRVGRRAEGERQFYFADGKGAFAPKTV